MRLRHIEIFNAVYTAGSISSAAKLLNVSQPSVSKVLRHAEDQLGFKLFDRVKNGLIPTAEAHQLFVDVEKVEKQIARLRQSARNLRDKKTDHIRIAMITGLGFSVTPCAISRFKEKHPKVSFALCTEHFPALLSALLERRADIGLVFQPPSHPNIKSVELGAGELVCVFQKGEFRKVKERISIADFEDRPFISMTEDGPLGAILAATMRRNDVVMNTEIVAETGFIATSLVRAGLGVTIIDELTAAAAGDDLDYRKLDPPIQFSINGIYPESHPVSETSREFFACFNAVYEEFQASLAWVKPK